MEISSILIYGAATYFVGYHFWLRRALRKTYGLSWHEYECIRDAYCGYRWKSLLDFIGRHMPPERVLADSWERRSVLIHHRCKPPLVQPGELVHWGHDPTTGGVIPLPQTAPINLDSESKSAGST
jgi:hypothetical protein